MRVFLPALLLLHLAALAATVPSYVFTDATATIPSTATGPVAYQVKTIIPGGWGPEAAGTGAVKDGAIALKPLTEGIHVVTVAGAETRFLAMAPPERLDRKALRTALPHTGAKLLAGQPYTVLFLGDSVTSTGDYKTLLKMMLTRALGKADIRLVDRSRYGMTTDYSVRRYAQDITPVHPDLTLIMYGLNDQRSWDLGAYVEQIRYLAEHITRDGGDVLLLTPTPHFVSENDFKGGRPYGDALRTVQYADAVQRLARELKLPAADTFNPMWHGTTLEGAFRASWGLYPPDFGHQLTSVVETNGTGDPVHPNALGQLQIARAAYRALAQQVPRSG